MRTESLKKNSSEDRAKKNKPKPSKRRRDSSLSSYSSDSGDASRGRRKAASRREPKKSRRSMGRRKEPKKPEKKKSRKTSYRRDVSVSSTSSGSSRSCSTCRGRSTSRSGRYSDASRSPVRSYRKAKLGLTGRSRERRQRRSRKRSCSTCSGYASYSDSSSCSRSPGEEKYRDRARSRSRRSVRDGQDKEKRSRDEDKAKIIKAYDDFQSSKSNSSHSAERKREDRTKMPVAQQRESEKKRWPEGVEDMGRDNATQAQVKDGVYEKEGEMIFSKISNQPAESIAADSGGIGRRDGKLLAHEIGLTKEDAMRKMSKVVANTGGSEACDLEVILRQKALENFKKYQGQLSVKKSSDGYRKDESVLVASDKDTGRVVETKQLCQVVKKSVMSLESKHSSSLEQHRSEVRERLVTKPVPRVSSLVISREENEGNPPVSPANDNESCKLLRSNIISSSKEALTIARQNLKVHESSNKMYSEQASLAEDTQDKRQDLSLHESCNKMPSEHAPVVKDTQDKRENVRVHESSNKMSSEQASLGKGIQHKPAPIELGSSKAGVKKVDGSASGASSCQNTETPTCNSIEHTAGSQFEQKTFSRMHDGEMVQVSYKVYIPKTSRALARRRLQR